jgi:hypothetical protein
MIRIVEISMTLCVDDSRDIDLTDTVNWNVVLIDRVNDQVILDTELDLPGEQSFQPSISVT